MGCGASTAVRTSTSNQASGASVVPPKSIIANGNAGRPRRKSGPRNNADAKLSPTLSSSSDSTTNSDAVNAKQLKRPLSSIDEGVSENAPQNVAVQADLESEFGIKSQYVQTELELNPEDELELLMNEENIEYDDDPDTDAYDLSNNNNNRISSVHRETSAVSVVRDNPGNADRTNADVAVQVKRTRTCSTQTRSLGVSNYSKLHHDTMVASSDNNIKHRTTAASNNVTFKHHRQQHATSATKQHPRLWTAPSKPTDIEKLSPKQHDFESQTDPISQALAANAADSDLNVLHSYEISSPFSHIERELGAASDSTKKDKRNFDMRLQECLNKLLDDMEDSFGTQKTVQKRDASVQTYNDPITDEAPEYAARPPPCRKKEMIPSLNLFKDIDKRAIECPANLCSALPTLVDYLCSGVPNDLFKVRAIFRWITHNIKYDWKYMGVTLTSSEILRLGEGVCKDYCLIFGDMCRAAGLRVKKIQGFAKGYEYRPGYHFKPGEDIAHNWNAVYVLGAWRFVDTTWGTGYTDHSGKFQRKLNEHFFLTFPEILIWSHFPYDENESDYSRWQLLVKPLTLHDFNGLPKVTPFFFEFNLKIRTKIQNPLEFRVQTEIKIGAHEPMRYKYKLYPADEVENSSLNHFAFCQLKEDRLVGSFVITPPVEARYFLKVYTKPEREMLEGSTDSSSLHSVVTFLLECNRARKYLEPFPLNELPWGPTQAFYDFKMKIHNQMGPIISSWGGKRKLTIESIETMLVTNQIFDAEGMELDIRTIVLREENGNKISFTISPPRVGMFKFMLFGMPKPKQKGKWRLPLLATFLVDCKLAKLPPQEEDPPPLPANYVVEPAANRRK